MMQEFQGMNGKSQSGSASARTTITKDHNNGPEGHESRSLDGHLGNAQEAKGTDQQGAPKATIDGKSHTEPWKLIDLLFQDDLLRKMNSIAVMRWLTIILSVCICFSAYPGVSQIMGGIWAVPLVFVWSCVQLMMLAGVIAEERALLRYAIALPMSVLLAFMSIYKLDGNMNGLRREQGSLSTSIQMFNEMAGGVMADWALQSKTADAEEQKALDSWKNELHGNGITTKRGVGPASNRIYEQEYIPARDRAASLRVKLSTVREAFAGKPQGTTPDAVFNEALQTWAGLTPELRRGVPAPLRSKFIDERLSNPLLAPLLLLLGGDLSVWVVLSFQLFIDGLLAVMGLLVNDRKVDPATAQRRKTERRLAIKRAEQDAQASEAVVAKRIGVPYLDADGLPQYSVIYVKLKIDGLVSDYLTWLQERIEPYSGKLRLTWPIASAHATTMRKGASIGKGSRAVTPLRPMINGSSNPSTDPCLVPPEYREAARIMFEELLRHNAFTGEDKKPSVEVKTCEQGLYVVEATIRPDYYSRLTHWLGQNIVDWLEQEERARDNDQYSRDLVQVHKGVINLAVPAP